MQEETFTIPIEGIDGAAVGSVDSSIFMIGRFAGLFLAYTTQPSTCVVTVTEIESGNTIATITGNTDDLFFPTERAHTPAGADAPNAVRVAFPLYGRIKIAVTVGNVGSISARVRWDRWG